jgi:hypothetical protein
LDPKTIIKPAQVWTGINHDLRLPKYGMYNASTSGAQKIFKENGQEQREKIACAL